MVCYSNLPIKDGREVAGFCERLEPKRQRVWGNVEEHTTLVIPPGGPSRRTERAIGEEELKIHKHQPASHMLNLGDEIPQEPHTCLQGLNSSPLARMHLW